MKNSYKETPPTRTKATHGTDLAHGVVDEDARDSRIFGTSKRKDFIFSVR
jgi:hypothetical protein